MSRQNLAATEVVDSVAHEDEREKRHKSQAKAASRQDVDPARLGGELSGGRASQRRDRNGRRAEARDPESLTMVGRRKLEGNPADRRIDGPDAVIPKRREPNPDAASRLSIEKARVGNELSADPLPYDESESAEALKRVENEGRP